MVCVELGREKHRGGLQDPVRATQLEHLLAQLADLLALLAARQIRPQPTVGLSLPDALAQRLVPDPRSRATCATGRPDSSATRTPRSINSCGYLDRLAMRPDFLPRGWNPRNSVSVKSRQAHGDPRRFTIAGFARFTHPRRWRPPPQRARRARPPPLQ